MPHDTNFGLGSLWAQGDAISHAVAVLLLLMSLGSWYLIVRKSLRLLGQRTGRPRSMPSGSLPGWRTD